MNLRDQWIHSRKVENLKYSRYRDFGFIIERPTYFWIRLFHFCFHCIFSFFLELHSNNNEERNFVNNEEEDFSISKNENDDEGGNGRDRSSSASSSALSTPQVDNLVRRTSNSNKLVILTGVELIYYLCYLLLLLIQPKSSTYNQCTTVIVVETDYHPPQYEIRSWKVNSWLSVLASYSIQGSFAWPCYCLVASNKNQLYPR